MAWNFLLIFIEQGTMKNQLRSKFFSVPLKPTLYRSVIKKLVAARIKNYDPIWVRHTFSKAVMTEVLSLVKTLAKKILISNFEQTKEHRKDLTYLNQLLFSLAQRNQKDIIFYAANLLQFYTIICDDFFKNHPSFKDLKQFLNHGQTKFGITTENPFILEYQLIALYNDFDAYSHQLENHLENSASIHSKIQSLETDFKQIICQLNHLYQSNPDHLFYQNLQFIAYYTMAKFNELELHMKKNQLTAQEVNVLIQQQNTHLKKAQSFLHSISENIQKETRHGQFALGREYWVNQKIFTKFPEHDLEAMNAHIQQLLTD